LQLQEAFFITLPFFKTPFSHSTNNSKAPPSSFFPHHYFLRNNMIYLLKSKKSLLLFFSLFKFTTSKLLFLFTVRYQLYIA